MELQCVGAKRISQHDIASSLKILAVDIHHLVRMLDIPYFRKFAGLKPLGLKQSAHSSVKI